MWEDDDIASLMQAEITRPTRRKMVRNPVDRAVTKDDALFITSRKASAGRGYKVDRVRAKRAVAKECKSFTAPVRHRESCAKYRTENRESINASKRAYYAANRQRLLSQRKTAVARERHRQHAALYREKNRATIADKRRSKQDLNRKYNKEYREFQKMLRWFVREQICHSCLSKLRSFSELESLAPLNRPYAMAARAGTP